MPANVPLQEPDETFAKMLATGLAPQQAYTESRIGVTHSCSVDQAMRLPGVWSRVQWLKANPSLPEVPREPPIELGLDPSQIAPTDIKRMLLKDHALACAMGQVSAAVRAAELLGKEEGMFIDRSEQKIDIRHAIAVRLDDAIRRVDPKRLKAPA